MPNAKEIKTNSKNFQKKTNYFDKVFKKIAHTVLFCSFIIIIIIIM